MTKPTVNKIDQKLTVEEKALDSLLTKDFLVNNRASPEELEAEKKRLSQYKVQKPAKKMISLRVLENDIIKIKSKAEMMGIPYQSYIVEHIHKLAQG